MHVIAAGKRTEARPPGDASRSVELAWDQNQLPCTTGKPRHPVPMAAKSCAEIHAGTGQGYSHGLRYCGVCAVLSVPDSRVCSCGFIRLPMSLQHVKRGARSAPLLDNLQIGKLGHVKSEDFFEKSEDYRKIRVPTISP